MTNLKPSYASPLPSFSERDFPSLGKATDPEKLENMIFKRYLVIKDIQNNQTNTDNSNKDNDETNENKNETQTKKKKEKVSDLTVF